MYEFGSNGQCEGVVTTRNNIPDTAEWDEFFSFSVSSNTVTFSRPVANDFGKQLEHYLRLSVDYIDDNCLKIISKSELTQKDIEIALLSLPFIN